MDFLSVVIFVTGAAVLALELLASRIMTPYFGVSLYIWTGILSITLVSLALGYFIGGRLSQRIHDQARRELTFLLLPAVSAISLGIACLVYPWTFFQLARANLVAGSFAACLILLFAPLVTISAMNPLLVALRAVRGQQGSLQGDSGAGLVFFISTAGSVIGVWVTAFVFIPNITNYRSVLILGLTLALIPLPATLRPLRLGAGEKRTLLLTALAGILLCGGLLAGAGAYLHKSATLAHNDYLWKIEKEYTSLFGDIKVLNITSKHPGKEDGHRMPLRMYYQDGIMQNLIDNDGVSLDIYSYALQALGTTSPSRGSPSHDRAALVLGLAGGIVPMKLAQWGITVDVVEINPDAVNAAREFFGFDPRRVTLYQTDARSYAARCRRSYHTIIVDLFQGDGIPDYLLSRNFFHDLKNCLNTGGAVIFNTFAIPELMPAYYHLLKTISVEFPQLYMFHDDVTRPDKTIGIYLLAGSAEFRPRLNLSMQHVPAHLQNKLRRIFSSARPIDRELLARSTVVTDEYNIFPLLNAENYLRYRRDAIRIVPWRFLVN